MPLIFLEGVGGAIQEVYSYLAPPSLAELLEVLQHFPPFCFPPFAIMGILPILAMGAIFVMPPFL